MRTALYLRVSTAQQKPDLQRDDLRSYAERTGLAIITEYTDVAVSGRKEGRPQLHALMQAARMRAFECVLVWKIRSLRTECDAPLTGVGGVQPSADPLYQPSGPDRYAEPHGQSDVYDYWGDGRVGVRTDCGARQSRHGRGEGPWQAVWTPAHACPIVARVEALASTTIMSIRQIYQALGGRVSRSIVGEIVKRVRHPP